MRWGHTILASLLLAGGCANVSADPFGRRMNEAQLDEALAPISGACEQSLRDAFSQGTRPQGCVEERRNVAGNLVRGPGERFGLVDQKTVDLRGVSLVVVEARRCSAWPLRAPGFAVLTRAEALEANCRLTRYTGPLEVTAFEEDGTSYPAIIELTAYEGVVRLSFAEADAVVRAHGFSGLDAFAELQLGRRGWAGTVNLARLREYLGLWHFVWVVRGRGVPGLFAAAHPEHERVGDARALSVEAALARQEKDYLAVAAGDLSPRRFLQRYVWSPYRRSVGAMSGAIPVPAPRIELEPLKAAAGVEADVSAEPVSSP